jgi:YidC/Oxa1 family membrane protein insertase
MSQNLRLILACILSTIILLVWQIFFVDPLIEEQRLNNPVKTQAEIKQHVIEFKKRNELIKHDFQENSRIAIENDKIKGSINLTGARFDDITLTQYKISQKPDSDDVVLLSPNQSQEVYFAEFGWISNDQNIELPTSKTKWQSNNHKLTSTSPIILHWTNSQGVKFIIEISLDKDYLFHVKQSVVNNSSTTIHLSNYATLARSHVANTDKNIIIHEGAIGVFEQKLKEIEFEDLKKDKAVNIDSQASWAGFSDKYWLTAIIPDKSAKTITQLNYNTHHNTDRYQASLVQNSVAVAKGDKFITESKFFAGAKELELLDAYESQYSIPLFDRAVDFGVLYFITKPIFLLLHYFYDYFANFGVAILLLTVFIKLLLFPLAHKGFIGMNRLKDLQPKMVHLKEKYQDKPAEFQKALLELYRKEKVNPMAGCLPILLQIPIFFALYKVLYVTIEMRHAPFFGWIVDLSAKDPTSIFNLFGLINIELPEFLQIGVFPILMAFTMFVQQKLNPEPTDPVQAKVMKLLPLIFLFMFSSFPSGLVIYWAWSNILSILQQFLIKKLTTTLKKA